MTTPDPATHCQSFITMPGFNAIGLEHLRCWRPLPCEEHEGEENA